MSNCMMSKIGAITKICRCAELTDALNTWRKTFTMIVIMLCYIEIFISCQGLMRTSLKHYSKCKTVWIKFRIDKFYEGDDKNENDQVYRTITQA